MSLAINPGKSARRRGGAEARLERFALWGCRYRRIGLL